jgi:hypothetical protein
VDTWTGTGWNSAAPLALNGSASWAFSFALHANNFDFPTFPRYSLTAAAAAGDAQDDEQFNVDERAILTSVYASSLGALATYELPSLAAPSLATPSRAYEGLYNFCTRTQTILAHTDARTHPLLSSVAAAVLRVRRGSRLVFYDGRNGVHGRCARAAGRIPHFGNVARENAQRHRTDPTPFH